LPLEYRARLVEQGWEVGFPRIARKFISSDGTVRYLVELADGETVETVWMPEGDGGESGDGSDAGDEIEGAPVPVAWRRATICVSSQVGCAVNCKFCFTALLGVKRNLEAGEIVGQIAAVLREQGVEPPLQRVNIVFMGMGEPFLNYDNFMKSVRLLAEGVGIPESRMTVSTAGIVPRIHDFGQETLRPKLAISLNASNDEQRDMLMPINKKYPLSVLMNACREYPLRTWEHLTFEYVMLGGVNDAAEDARRVVRLLAPLKSVKMNLIPWNPGELPYQESSPERIEEFRRILVDRGVPAFVRYSRGRDVMAACGQLALLQVDSPPFSVLSRGRD